MSEFTPEEREFINSISKQYQQDINLADIAEIISSPDFSPYDTQHEMLTNPDYHKRKNAELWAAVNIVKMRDISEELEDGNDKKVRELILLEKLILNENTAAHGLQLIKDVEEFWRFKPTIELIFELGEEDLEKAEEYARVYENSSYHNAVRPHRNSLVQNFKRWDHSDLSTNNIKRGKRMYDSCFKIFERGFANLLALKRILDDENPKLSTLQKKSAAAVRRELTENDPESNSVYFDLIVQSFDSGIRNAVAHNDIVINPPDSTIYVPTKDDRYSYEEFNDVIKQNFANGIFLTGTCNSLLKWYSIASRIDTYEERPDWVFGERSIT